MTIVKERDRGLNTPVTFRVPLPPSVNALYRNVPGRGRVKTPKYSAWIKSAGWEVISQRPAKLSGSYSVKYSLCRPDNRRRDAENYIKALSDLLVRLQIVEDDSRAVSTTVAWDGTEVGFAVVTITSQG